MYFLNDRKVIHKTRLRNSILPLPVRGIVNNTFDPRDTHFMLF